MTTTSLPPTDGADRPEADRREAEQPEAPTSGPTEERHRQPGPGWWRRRQAARAAAPVLNRHQARVRLIVRVLVAAQITYVTWACFRGFFFTDDLVILGRSARAGWFDPELLLQPWGGHFMPAAFALAQVSGKLSNLDYGFVAAGLAIGQAVVVLLVTSTLRYLVGWRYRLVPLVLLYLVSIPVLQASVWWASALNAMPYLATMALAVRFLVGYLLEHRAWQALAATATTATGLLFFEKAVLLLPLLFMVAVTLAPRRRLGRAVSWALRRARWLWLALVVVAIAWAAAYSANPTSQTLGGPQPGVLGDQIAQGLPGTFLPSFLGGPWSFGPAPDGGAGYGVASAPAWVALSCLVLAALVAGWLMTFGFRARRALATVAGYAVLVVVALNLGRSVFLTSTTNLPRYYADLVLVTVLMLALATARLRLDPDRPGLAEPSVAREHKRAVAVSGIVLGYALVTSALVAATSLVSGLAVPFTRNYMLTASSDLTQAGPNASVLRQAVPGRVLGPLSVPYNSYDWVFAPLHAGPEFPDVTDRLLVVDDFGRVGPGWVNGVWSEVGDIAGCGWKVTSTSPVIPLQQEVPTWQYTVRIGYLFSSTAPDFVGSTGTVQLGRDGTPVAVNLRGGLHDLYVNVEGGGSFVRIDGIPPGEILCVDRVTVGQVLPGIQPQIPASPAQPGGADPLEDDGPAAEPTTQPSPEAGPKENRPGGGSGREDSRRRDRDRNRDDAGSAG